MPFKSHIHIGFHYKYSCLTNMLYVYDCKSLPEYNTTNFCNTATITSIAMLQLLQHRKHNFCNSTNTFVRHRWAEGTASHRAWFHCARSGTPSPARRRVPASHGTSTALSGTLQCGTDSSCTSPRYARKLTICASLLLTGSLQYKSLI